MSHYQFKKWFFILVGLLGLAAMSELQAQKKQPNILVIMADDIGLTNLGCYGGDIMGVPTPNIDRIASQGLKLTSFYGQPSCTAGRAAFITGQLPIRTGMTTVGVPGSEVGLQPEDPTLADVLKSKGYATAQFGKNHLGDLEKFLPHRHGFDVFYGNLYHLNANEDPEDLDRPSDPAYKKKYDPRGVISGTATGPTIDEGPLTTERMKNYDKEILAKTEQYIKAQSASTKPFFVWYNPSRLHVFQHLNKDEIGVSRASKNGEDKYGDALAEHDKEVGELLKLIDDLKLTENTIVIYTTDNGPYQYMWPEGGTTPFRGDKGTTWEGAVRIPCIIRWPGKVQPGTQNSEIMSLEDLFTTFASVAGEPDVAEKLKKGTTYNGKQFKVLLEGVDQTDLITGKGPSKRNYYFYYDETNLTAIRYNQFKLVFSSKREGKWDDELQPYGRALLINLLMDPYERRTDDDLTRQLAEHKTWVFRPILDLMEKHLTSFKEFPPRQKPMSGDFTKMIEGMMLQLQSGNKD
jgi:arylsulfatase A-like enzyme